MMKKIGLLLTTIILASSFSFGQVRLGLRLAPNISLTQIESSGQSFKLENDGSALRFSFGPFVDFHFTDNVAFQTGLWFSTKQVKAKFEELETNTKGSQEINLQYLQLPVAIKFYTAEIANELKLYFLLGGTVDIEIDEKIIGSNSLFAGFNYNRGLTNIAKKDFFSNNSNARDELNISTSLISLEMGILF